MRNKDYFCIIPARAGSKTIKNKNFIKIKNKILIQYTIDTAKKISDICDICISSNSKKIKKICEKNNIEFNGYRPKKLSSDYAKTSDVIKYEIKKAEKIKKKKYKYILLLQPTCPVRDIKKIKKSLKLIKNNKYDSVISINDVGNYHPYRMKKIIKGKLVDYLNYKNGNFIPRQKLPKIYIRSGSIYLVKRDVFFKTNSFLGKNCFGIKVEGNEKINIDTFEDLEKFKKMAK